MPTANHDTITPTRRTALGFSVAAFAAGLAAPAVALAGATNPDAELLSVAADFMVSQERLWPSDRRMSTGLSDDEAGAEIDRWYAAMDRVAELPARTPAGRRAKIEVAHAALWSTAYSNGSGLDREEQCALGVLAELLGSAVA